MKSHRRQHRSREVAELRARLADAEETLRAIRSGEVDAVVVAGKQGPQVFTLEGAGHAYRMLIESMNEGALTLAGDKMIVYANGCFARMVKCPLEQVLGGSFLRFLSAADGARLRLLMKSAHQSGAKLQVLLKAGNGSQVPAQISIRPLDRNGGKHAPIGMVVTDMTEAQRTEELLRALTHRVVQAQEAERGSVALDLHDNVTQMLCAILARSQALANRLTGSDGAPRQDAITLREMLGAAAVEVERISRNLRPSVLEHLGLAAVLRAAGTEFAQRTGVSVKVACVNLAKRLPINTEMALFRIVQQALTNVEQHARARHVTVQLTKPVRGVQLTIQDDGIGFDPEPHANRGKGKGGLGLLSMRERASNMGGDFKVKSIRGTGTKIEVRIPVPPKVPEVRGTDV